MHWPCALHHRVRSALGLTVLVTACGNVTTPEVKAVGGVYILTQVDGVPLPAPPPAPGSAVPCPPAITDGELSLTPVGSRNYQQYGILAYLTRACDPGGIPIEATSVLNDAGDWSIAGNEISFTSSPYNRKGSYKGTVQSTSPVPVVAVAFAGHTYTYRRLADQTRESSLVTVLVVDEQGARVDGAFIVFHSATGLVTRTFTDTISPPFTASASPGTEVINIGPPSGYTFAPGQPNPVTLTLAANATDTTKVVLARTAP